MVFVFALLTMLSSYLVVFLFNTRTVFDGGISLGSGLNSSYFVVCILPWLFLIENRWVKTVFLFIAVAAVLFSMKRTSILVLGIQLLSYLLMMERKKGGIVAKILMGSVLFVGIYYIFMYISDTYLEGGVISRFEMVENDELGGRMAIWKILFQKYSESPFILQFLGHGCNAFIEDGGIRLTAHNDYFETLYDFGFLGVALLLLFIGYLISRVKRVFEYWRNLGVAYVMGLIAFVVIMMSSHLLFIHPCQIVFLTALWGYAIGASERKRTI